MLVTEVYVLMCLCGKEIFTDTEFALKKTIFVPFAIIFAGLW